MAIPREFVCPVRSDALQSRIRLLPVPALRQATRWVLPVLPTDGWVDESVLFHPVQQVPEIEDAPEGRIARAAGPAARADRPVHAALTRRAAIDEAGAAALQVAAAVVARLAAAALRANVRAVLTTRLATRPTTRLLVTRLAMRTVICLMR